MGKNLRVACLCLAMVFTLFIGQYFYTKGVPREECACSVFLQTASNLQEQYEIPGFQLAVARDGQLLYHYEQGLANTSTKEKITQDSIFRIASLTKPLTALITTSILNKKKISLETPIKDYLPFTFQDKTATDITFHQLLNHTAGWDREKGANVLTAKKALLSDNQTVTEESLLNYIRQQPLVFKPGSRYVYANFDYVVLGVLLEQLTGISYLSLVHQEFGSKLYSELKEQPKNEVRYYDPYGQDFIDLKAIVPAGGLKTTATNLATIISRQDISKLNQGQDKRYLAEGKYYSLGINVWPKEGVFYYTHSGSIPGTYAILVFAPDRTTYIGLFNGTILDFMAAQKLFVDKIAR